MADLTEGSAAASGTQVHKDGVRMMHLRDALRKTIKKCIDSAKYSTFSRHYGKHMADRNPQALKSLLQQFKEQLEGSIKTELELMIEEENLVPLFNDLDKVTEEAQSGYDDMIAWRPSGEPTRDSQNLVINIKLKEKERLQRALQHAEEEGDRLKEELTIQKQKLIRTQKKIKEHLDSFGQAAEASDKVPSAPLQKVLCQLTSSPPSC